MHHLSVLSLAIACLAGVVSASGDHGHGNPEYLALYSLGVAGTYTLELGGEGEEDSIEFMVVPSSSLDNEGLEEAAEASATGELHPIPCTVASATGVATMYIAI